MPFSARTLDFLFENRLNNSREWFKEHKNEYKELVEQPFKEFTDKLAPYIADIDSGASLMRISRIYRDVRFVKDGFIFRENMWCTFGRMRDLYKAMPAFYFDISAAGFEYGCGYYCASSESMEAFRQLILSDSPYYIAAYNDFSNQDIFEMYGDIYKKNRFPAESPEKCSWLNRKTVGICSPRNDDFELMFSDRLADRVGEDLQKMASFYDLLMKAEELAAEKRAK